MATNVAFASENRNERRKEIVCQLCKESSSKYVCPRCSVNYCSLVCYRSERHSSCSEEFYKEWVMSELKNDESSKEDQQRVKRILLQEKRKQEEENEMKLDENENSLENRMSDLDFDDDKAVWARLSDAERREFEELVREDKVHQFMPELNVWWLKKNPLVLEADAPKETNHPPLCPNIPHLSTLISRGKSNPCIGFNVINVLCSYVVMWRFYHGEPLSVARDASRIAMNLSRNLGSNDNFQRVRDAVLSVVQEANQLRIIDSPDAGSVAAVVEDVRCVIEGPNKTNNDDVYVAAAISDLHRILKMARKEPEHAKDDESKVSLSKANKKLMFYLSWLRENRLDELIPQLQALQNETKLESEVNSLEEMISNMSR